jgi:uncharacterized membrane protein YedE/YeeE
MIIALGGFMCGAIAGASARYGRMCTMGAIEEAIVASDFRRAKAWGFAMAVAIAATAVLEHAGFIELSASLYAQRDFDWLGALVGGLLFGFGMSLAGTCSFGLLVRAGSGDLRAIITSVGIGIAAFAATAGPLALMREPLVGFLAVGDWGEAGPRLPSLVPPEFADGAAFALALLLALPALLDARVTGIRRLLTGAASMGLAIAAGWAVTGAAIARLEPVTLESLSFVAPTGRLILQLMTETTPFASFGVASVLGVVVGAAVMSLLMDEFRWEAFDDPREMRRHLLGACLMGLGGVLAGGCTIGLGMTAASALTFTAPLFLVGLFAGARLGLGLLLGGVMCWKS